MLGVFLVVLAGLFWASDAVIRYPMVGAGISPEKIVFAEHLLLCIIFSPMFFSALKKFKQMKFSSYIYFFVIGVLGSAVATLAMTKAFGILNPSLVILLQKLQPVVAISLARIFLGERIKPLFIFWAALALFGGFLISSPDIMPGLAVFDFKTQALTPTAMFGYFLTFICILCWGASTVFGKKLSQQGFSEFDIMSGRFYGAFAFMAIYLFFQNGTLTLSWEVETYGKVFILVLLSGVAGMYMYYQGLKRISARACAIAETFFPFSAIILNWVFLGTKLQPIQILGAAILAVASTVIQYKKY